MKKTNAANFGDALFWSLLSIVNAVFSINPNAKMPNISVFLALACVFIATLYLTRALEDDKTDLR